MKKIFASAALVFMLFTAANAQVMEKQGMKNTTWIGMGAPLDGDFMFYGLMDTFQARFDIGKFTIEGMLNWSFLANYGNDGDVDNFIFGTSNRNPLSLHYGNNANTNNLLYNNAVNTSSLIQDSYYVNFFWHINRYFDFGVGTKLNWQIGNAPRYGAWLWEADAHIRAGGFSTSYDDRSGSFMQTSSEAVGSYKFTVDAPGSADVVGFVPYANKYAKRALGVRFVYPGDIGVELGFALPNGFNTDAFPVNLAARITPLKWLSISAALEGAFEDKANFYAGTEIGTKNFLLDVYFAADSLFTDTEDDQAYSLGLAFTFDFPKYNIMLRPEGSLNFFENDDYSAAWYVGADFDLALNKNMGIGVWASFANGSKNKKWADTDVTDEWDGGHIFDIRPSFHYAFASHWNFTVYADIEFRTAFDGQSRDCQTFGMFLTYTF